MWPRSQNRILSPARRPRPRPLVGEAEAGECFDYGCDPEGLCCRRWFGERLDCVLEGQQQEEESRLHWEGQRKLDIDLARRKLGKRGNSPRWAAASGRFKVAMCEQLADVSANRRRLHDLGKGFDVWPSISKGKQSLGEVDHAAITHSKLEDLNERGATRSRSVML